MFYVVLAPMMLITFVLRFYNREKIKQKFTIDEQVYIDSVFAELVNTVSLDTEEKENNV
jgi:hypothetical protein